jgi:hypothetical protein
MDAFNGEVRGQDHLLSAPHPDKRGIVSDAELDAPAPPRIEAGKPANKLHFASKHGGISERLTLDS